MAPSKAQSIARPSTIRRYDFDALRVLAVLVLLVYHSTRAFDTEAWHLKSADLSRALELFGYALTPWRLPLLFLIAGAGTYFSLRTRSARTYGRDRVRRLLLPLGVGMVLVVPPQVYVERAPYSTRYVVMLTLRGVTEWCALIGVLGYARRYLDRPRAWLRWAGDRVPPFYIWHQTVLVVIGVWIVRWPTGVGVKFAAILVATLVATILVCELGRRTNVTRVAFGMRPKGAGGT